LGKQFVLTLARRLRRRELGKQFVLTLAAGWEEESWENSSCEDFTQYYVDPNAENPVANELLTFDLLYEKVLRTYYLLYPVMIPYVQLNSEDDVCKNAKAILQATEPSTWMSIGYMPRTRDMSSSRTRLLRAWCRKVLYRVKLDVDDSSS
jgi:hypothetical protein